MPDEQKEVPTPSPEQAAAPAAPQQTPVADQTPTAPPAKKKTNGCVIAIIIVAVLIVLGGIAAFFAYKYVSNKVSNVIDTSEDSASINIGDTKSSVSTSGSSYDQVTEQTPTVDYLKNANTELSPVFREVFGGAKLNAWVSLDSSNGNLTYTTKDKISPEDYSVLKGKLSAIGYVSTEQEFTSGEGSMLFFTKGELSLNVILNTDDTSNSVLVNVSKEEPAQ